MSSEACCQPISGTKPFPQVEVPKKLIPYLPEGRSNVVMQLLMESNLSIKGSCLREKAFTPWPAYGYGRAKQLAQKLWRSPFAQGRPSPALRAVLVRTSALVGAGCRGSGRLEGWKVATSFGTGPPIVGVAL